MDCLACGLTSAKASREHVFAEWILQHFSASRLEVGLNKRLPNGIIKLERKAFVLDSFRLKKICGPCNNGWMSELETKASPLIIKLIKETVVVSDLSEDEREVLARWAGKTAIVESHAVGAECPVNPAFLRQLRRNIDRHPGNFAVAACKSEFDGFGHMQVGIILDLIGGGKVSGNIIVLAIPKLVFIVGFPMLDIGFQCRLAPPFEGLWPPDPRRWHLMKGNFAEMDMSQPDTMPRFAERIQLFQNVGL